MTEITKKKLIIILGMHRSGTSLIAKAVGMAGAELGDNLISPDKDNPKGYLEDLDFNSFNENLLKFIQSQWDTPTLLSLVDFTDVKFLPFLESARTLLKQKFTEDKLYAVKDPRFCLLLSFWQRALDKEGVDIQFVVVFRNPHDVAHSLLTRNQIDVSRGLRIWLNHNYLLLKTLLSHPEKKLFIEYSKVLKSPREEFGRLFRFVSNGGMQDMTQMEQEFVNEYLDLSLCHSNVEQEELMNYYYDVSGVKDIYRLLRDFSGSKWSKVQARSVLKNLETIKMEAENYRLQLDDLVRSKNREKELMKQEKNKELQRLESDKNILEESKNKLLDEILCEKEQLEKLKNEELQKLLCEKEQLEKLKNEELQKLFHINALFEKENKFLINRVKAIKSSASYKIGRFATWIFRKL